jgi:hypothetical protein
MKFGESHVPLVLAVCVVFLRPGLTPAALDTISLGADKSVEGLFLGYENGRFEFRGRDGKTTRLLESYVKSLRLSPPAAVIVKLRGHKEESGIKFVDFENSRFTLDRGSAEFTAPAATVTSIQLWDFGRTLDALPETQAAAADDGKGVESLLKAGRVSVVHFHKADVVSSVRQGNYLASCAEKSKGRINLVKLEITDWDCPVAVRYGIKSAPQFWFYGPKGKQAAKLVERFTDQDLDDALEKAKRF